MGDIALQWDALTGYGDFAMAGPDLLAGEDLQTAVLISLFTDAPAEPGDPAWNPNDDPRGFWADAYAAGEDPNLAAIPADATGSKLWQIFDMPRNQATLNWAADQVRKSLGWMIVDGVAAAVDGDAYFVGSGGVGIVATITRPDGTRDKYDYAWSQEG